MTDNTDKLNELLAKLHNVKPSYDAACDRLVAATKDAAAAEKAVDAAMSELRAFMHAEELFVIVRGGTAYVNQNGRLWAMPCKVLG